MYFLFVDSVYDNVLNMHILALALTCVIFVAFLLFVVRPFLKEVSRACGQQGVSRVPQGG